MEMLNTEIEIDKSFRRRQLFAKKYLDDSMSFINGLSKLKNYMLQNEPTADSLPVFVIPYCEKLKSLFSFMVRCENRNYECSGCFFRNECLRKTIKKISASTSRKLKKSINIDSLLKEENEDNLDIYSKQALILLKEIIIEIGKI
jgi:hypothetical protein